MPVFKFNKSRAGESLPIRVLYLSLLSFLNKGLDDYDVRTGFPLSTDGNWHKVCIHVVRRMSVEALLDA